MALGLKEVVRRFGYSRPTALTISLIEDNRHRAIELALHYDETLPEGHAKDQAILSLQNAAMWANAAIAQNAPPGESLPDDLIG